MRRSQTWWGMALWAMVVSGCGDIADVPALDIIRDETNKHAGDGGGKRAQHTNAKEHEDDPNQPAASGQGRNVPETDRGQRDNGPPQRVGKGPVVFKVGEPGGAHHDQDDDDPHEPEKVFAVQKRRERQAWPRESGRSAANQLRSQSPSR